MCRIIAAESWRMQTACLFNHFPLNINADEVRLEGAADRLFTGRHHCHNTNTGWLSHTYMMTDSLTEPLFYNATAG